MEIPVEAAAEVAGDDKRRAGRCIFRTECRSHLKHRDGQAAIDRRVMDNFARIDALASDR